MQDLVSSEVVLQNLECTTVVAGEKWINYGSLGAYKKSCWYEGDDYNYKHSQRG
jgi:hypothetical protein